MENLQNYFLNKLDEHELELKFEVQNEETSKGFVVYYDNTTKLYFGMYGFFNSEVTDYCYFCYSKNKNNIRKFLLNEIKR